MDTRIQNPRISELVLHQPTAPKTSVPAGDNSFRSLLEGNGVKVSGHAQTRLTSRNIELEESQWSRVREGIDKAAAKGSKESLVMVDDVALLVSVKNRTVITAVGKDGLRDNVFTNIDSAVIV